MPEIVKAGPNTAEYPMFAWNIEEVIAWERGVAAASALGATKQRYSQYLSGPFNAWFMSYDAGRAEEPYPPIPEGFDAQLSADGLGFDLVGSGAPCGPVPIYKKRVVTPSTGSFRPGVALLPTDQAIANAFLQDLANAGLGVTVTAPSGAKFVRIA